ncbi:MAG: lysoplasmalogenase [Clostridia bacterium]
MQLLALIPYVLLSVAHCWAAWAHNTRFCSRSKPFLMVLLLAGYCVAAPTVHPLMILGLCFGFLGDVCLMQSGQQALLAGLGSFLLGHLCYLALMISRTTFSAASLGSAAVACVLYACVALPLFRALLPSLGAMRMPVIAYLVVILLMAIAAVGFSVSHGNAYAALGGMLFVLSDAILAWGLFRKPLPAHSFCVMSTYVAAQCLLCLGQIL